MKNIKEISDRYENGLSGINLGDRGFYEINSNKPLKLNSYGGKDGWITNDKGEIEIFELTDGPFIHYLDDEEITPIQYHEILESINYDSEEEERIGLRTDHNNVKKWWGKTIDNYYPHPWYPNKSIKGFEIVNNLPGAQKGDFFELNSINRLWIEIHVLSGTAQYYIEDCLEYPEYFKPIYK